MFKKKKQIVEKYMILEEQRGQKKYDYANAQYYLIEKDKIVVKHIDSQLSIELAEMTNVYCSHPIDFNSRSQGSLMIFLKVSRSSSFNYIRIPFSELRGGEFAAMSLENKFMLKNPE